MAKAQLRKKSGIHAFDVVNYLVFIIISLIIIIPLLYWHGLLKSWGNRRTHHVTPKLQKKQKKPIASAA